MPNWNELKYVLQARVYCFLLAVAATLAIALFNWNFSPKYVIPGYVGVDALFSFLAIGFNLNVGRAFLVPFTIVTVLWLVAAFLLIGWLL